MTVQKHKILVVAFSQFDLIYLCNKCKKSFNIQHIDLICEEKCLAYVSELKGIKFNIKHSFKEKRPGFFTPKNIYNIFRIQNFFKKKSSQYDKILIGVYDIPQINYHRVVLFIISHEMHSIQDGLQYFI